MKLAQKRSKKKKQTKKTKTCCCGSAGLSHSRPDLGSFQTAVVQYKDMQLCVSSRWACCKEPEECGITLPGEELLNSGHS